MSGVLNIPTCHFVHLPLKHCNRAPSMFLPLLHCISISSEHSESLCSPPPSLCFLCLQRFSSGKCSVLMFSDNSTFHSRDLRVVSNPVGLTVRQHELILRLDTTNLFLSSLTETQLSVKVVFHAIFIWKGAPLLLYQNDKDVLPKK